MHGCDLEVTKNGTEVVLPHKIYLTDSLYGKSVIKNVTRHMVTKDCWMIVVNNRKPLYVTNDHSVIVYRER